MKRFSFKSGSPVRNILCFLFLFLLLVSPVFPLTFQGKHYETVKTKNDLWYSVYIQDQKAGWMNQKILNLKDKSGGGYDFSTTSLEISISRMGKKIKLNQKAKVLKDSSGNPLAFSLEMDTGPTGTMKFTGKMKNEKLVIKSYSLGRQGEKKTIDIDPDTFFPGMAEGKLKQAIKKGKKSLTLQGFLPELNQKATVTFKIKGKEKVNVGGEQKNLRKIEITNSILPQNKSVEWVNEDLIPEKMTNSISGITIDLVLTDKKRARGNIKKAKMLTDTFIHPEGKMPPNPENLKSLTLKLRFKKKPSEIPGFESQNNVGVLKKTPNTYKIKIKKGVPVEISKKCDGKFLKPGNIIQSDDPEIRETAKYLLKDVKSRRKKADKLVNWVYERIEEKSLGVAFGTAKEVYENLEGDCTEHAVLYAAMSRAAGIPARVASGLIYSREFQAFGYHMWNEVCVDGRWIALDPTFNQTNVDATHIKITHSSLGLADTAGFSSTLLDFINNVDIKILSHTNSKNHNNSKEVQ